MTRTTLQRRVLRSVALVALVAITASTSLVLFVLHGRVHEATDALLLQMARQDAAEVDRETEEPVHVHDTLLSLPYTAAAPMHRYAAVARGCEVLATTRTLSIRRLPDALCAPLLPGAFRYLTTTALTEHELRLVFFGAEGRDGQPVTYITGVDHAHVDAALWATTQAAVPAGVIVLLLVVLAAWLGVRSVSHDLRGLAAAGDALVKGEHDWRHAPGPRFEVGPRASQEVAALAASLELMLGTIRQSFRTQARFVAAASHELRTPLTALVGELEVALRRERSAEAYRQTLKELQGDAARLVDLAEHLLQAARAEAEAVPVRPTSVAELLTEAATRNRAVLGDAGVRVIIDCPPALSVVCHRLSMGQVLDNLLQNAARHAAASTVHLSARRQGERVILRVSDDGVGLPDSLTPHLFRPFQRGSDAAGHGLGLYIAAELMSRQAGALTLSSPQPATWELSLPAIAIPTEA